MSYFYASQGMSVISSSGMSAGAVVAELTKLFTKVI